MHLPDQHFRRFPGGHPLAAGKSQAHRVTRVQRAHTLHLDRAAGDSLDPGHAEALRFIAARLAMIADTLAEPDMQRLIARRAVQGDPADLKRR